MTALERLRQVAELLPTGTSVTFTREVLLEALGGTPDISAAVLAGDLTVAEVAAHFHRSPSTVRGWLEAGRFTGAYKLNGRDWRVARAAVDAFEAQQKGQRSPTETDLSAWRKHQKPARSPQARRNDG